MSDITENDRGRDELTSLCEETMGGGKQRKAGFGGSWLGRRRRLFRIRGTNVSMLEEAVNRFFFYFPENERVQGGQSHVMLLVACRK